MPNVSPGQKGIAPGIVTNQNAYPQWGVGGGTPGSSAGWKIVEAKNAAQKNSYLSQGYDVWFSSDSAAKSFLSSEESPYQSGEPQNAIPGLTQIGDFFGLLTQSNTWIRLGQIVLGVILVAVGLARVTHAVPAATKIAKTVGAVGVI